MAQPLRKGKKKTVLFLQSMLHLQCTKGTFYTNTGTSVSRVEPTHGNASAHNISILCKQGRLTEAIHILHLMDHTGIRPYDSIYASLLQDCVNHRLLPEGKQVHAHIIQTGFEPDIFLDTKLVILYAKCGGLIDARRLFEEMPKRNVVSWTAMIAAYAKYGYSEQALMLFYEMQRTGVQPNDFTFASVLPACANLATLEHGKKAHEDILKSGYESDVFVGSALIDMYVKCRSINDARKVFDRMPELDVVVWNTMIGGYAQNGYFHEALKLFEKMPERNVVSWTAMIAGYAQNGRVDDAEELFRKMPRQDLVSWNVMIAGYAQNGRLDEALELFKIMPERNVISWTALIAGYTQNGHFVEALEFYGQMKQTGLKPDSDTFASVLPACANLAALEHGMEVHEDMVRSGLHSDDFVVSALVDMYAKCGTINIARHVFDKMPKRNTVLWTAMIVGYAMHGCGKQALQLFEEMQHSGVNPDHVTFVGVLNACCHAGLVDAGWQYFHRMSQDYHITPTAEHYCCMVDLLGRAGHLDEARDFIDKMPIKSDAAVWGSLLGACRIYSNIELGEWVAERLLELDPKNPGHYVLLSNIYATAGRWDDMQNVRKMMKERRVNKLPGCSWIEVNGKVHTFLVGDISHPQTQIIYAELERLSWQMKEAGYIPNMNFALHDVEEEQKENILCHHSEKLAITFGLINTSAGTPIRIVKNLRVCGDCHSATKFISKIVAREIVVRDANRFHHFKDGLCSCGDYW